MLPFLIALLFILVGLPAVFVVFFVSRRFSPIPYFPSNGKDIEKILKILELKDNQILYDLGAGDGVVIFAAARASLPRSTRFVAIEINPLLILIMKLRRFFHPNHKHVSIVRADIFSYLIPHASKHEPIFFIYISPWYLEKTVVNLLRQYKAITLVTYFYALPRSRKYKMKLLKSSKNIHSVYRYSVTR